LERKPPRSRRSVSTSSAGSNALNIYAFVID
jgi:hypothetical protein